MIIWLFILIGLFALNIYYTPRLVQLVPCLVVSTLGLIGLYWLWIGKSAHGAIALVLMALIMLGCLALRHSRKLVD